MKRIFQLFLAACAVLGTFSCGNKDTAPAADPNAPSIKWEAYPSFTAEYMPTMDGIVAVCAPGGLDLLTIRSVSGNPDYVNVFAKTYIGVANNRTSNNIVFDLIDDGTVAANFVEKQICASAGSALRGSKAALNVNLLTLVNLLTDKQDIENNTNISFEIKLADASGASVTQTVTFHFTAAPAFTWANTVSTTTVPLESYAEFASVRVTAPASIKSISLSVSSESAKFNEWLNDRVSKADDGSIDILNAENNSTLKIWTSTPLEQLETTLDFSEILSNLLLYVKKEGSATGATHDLRITVKDGLEKSVTLDMKFKR